MANTRINRDKKDEQQATPLANTKVNRNSVNDNDDDWEGYNQRGIDTLANNELYLLNNRTTSFFRGEETAKILPEVVEYFRDGGQPVENLLWQKKFKLSQDQFEDALLSYTEYPIKSEVNKIETLINHECNRVIQFGIGVGFYVRQFPWQIIGYDMSKTAINYLNSLNDKRITTRQVDLNTLAATNGGSLTTVYSPKLKKEISMPSNIVLANDLRVPANIILVNILQYLDEPALIVFLNEIINHAASGSVIFIQNDAFEQHGVYQTYIRNLDKLKPGMSPQEKIDLMSPKGINLTKADALIKAKVLKQLGWSKMFETTTIKDDNKKMLRQGGKLPLNYITSFFAPRTDIQLEYYNTSSSPLRMPPDTNDLQDEQIVLRKL